MHDKFKVVEDDILPSRHTLPKTKPHMAFGSGLVHTGQKPSVLIFHLAESRKLSWLEAKHSLNLSKLACSDAPCQDEIAIASGVEI